MKLFKILERISICIGLFLMEACSGDINPLNYSKNGDLRYPGKVNNAIYYPGNNRLQLHFTLGPDPNVNKIGIYWNLQKDSFMVNIDRNALKNNIKEILIENLPENIYNFEIYTFDKFGNKSVPTYLTGRTYGPRYEEGLNNRTISSLEAANENGDVNILWNDSILYSYDVKVSYADKSNVTKTIIVSNKDSYSLLKNIDVTKDVNVTTRFLPEINAIDTFATAYSIKVNVKKLQLEIPKPYASGFVAGYDTPNNNGWNSLWDGKWGKTFSQNSSGSPWATEAGWKFFETKPSATATESWFTIDLSKAVKLSRYRTGFYWPYMNSCPKVTELWAYIGAGVPTAANGNTNWIRIGITDNSLLNINQMTEQYSLGDNIYIDYDSSILARFYRIKVLSNWGGTLKGALNIAEVTFWEYIY